MEMNTLEVFGQQLNNLAFNNTFICSNASTEPKTITFPTSYNLNSNLAFKVVFVNGHDCGSATYNFTLNGKPVKMNNSGTYQNLPVIQNGSTFYSIQPGMTLDLYYDNTQDAFVVVGNPVVISNSSEKVLADGSRLWLFTKDKISSDLGLTAGSYGGNAATATNADTVDGYHASESDAGSTVVARTASGYVNATYFHDNHGDENINSYGTPRLVFKGNNDGYLRSTDPANVSVGYASSAGNADTVDGQHFAYSNTDNNPTYLWGTNSNGSSILAHRASMSVASADQAYKVFTQSHPGSWWLNAEFDGSSLFILDTIEAGGSRIPIKVGQSGNADTVDGYHVGGSGAAGNLIPVQTSSFSGTSGYIVYTNGLIIQWGYASDGDSGRNVIMPLSFTSVDTYIFNCSILVNTAANNEFIIGQSKVSGNNFKIDTNQNRPFMWLAIGY